jgi:hypothetical protein
MAKLAGTALVMRARHCGVCDGIAFATAAGWDSAIADDTACPDVGAGSATGAEGRPADGAGSAAGRGATSAESAVRAGQRGPGKATDLGETARTVAKSRGAAVATGGKAACTDGAASGAGGPSGGIPTRADEAAAGAAGWPGRAPPVPEGFPPVPEAG